MVRVSWSSTSAQHFTRRAEGQQHLLLSSCWGEQFFKLNRKFASTDGRCGTRKTGCLIVVWNHSSVAGEHLSFQKARRSRISPRNETFDANARSHISLPRTMWFSPNVIKLIARRTPLDDMEKWVFFTAVRVLSWRRSTHSQFILCTLVCVAWVFLELKWRFEICFAVKLDLMRVPVAMLLRALHV